MRNYGNFITGSDTEQVSVFGPLDKYLVCLLEYGRGFKKFLDHTNHFTAIANHSFANAVKWFTWARPFGD